MSREIRREEEMGKGGSREICREEWERGKQKEGRGRKSRQQVTKAPGCIL